jgi:hypothetical protein
LFGTEILRVEIENRLYHMLHLPAPVFAPSVIAFVYFKEPRANGLIVRITDRLFGSMRVLLITCASCMSTRQALYV